MVRTACCNKAIALVATALCVAMTAQAAFWDWKGKTSSTSYFDDTSCWYKSGSTAFADSNHNISTERGHLNLDWDKTITFRENTTLTGGLNNDFRGAPVVFVAESDDCGITSSGAASIYRGAEIQIQSGTYSFGGNINVGSATATGGVNRLTLNGGTLRNTGGYIPIGVYANSTGIVTVATGAVYENLGSNGNMTIGHGNGALGILNVEGGEVTIRGQFLLCYTGGKCRAEVNVTDGGVLTVGRVVQNKTGTDGSVLTLDGGTLKAYAPTELFMPAYDELHVYVGANGGVIDTDGFDVTIGEDFDNVTGESGALRFTGGGTVTLTGAVNCASTAIDVGTKLALTTAAKTALFANGVTVAIPSVGASDGATILEIADGGTFTQGDIDDHAAVSGDSAGRYALVLADNGTKIAIADTLAGEYVWNGGASGASWLTAGNWTKNGVPGNWFNSTAAVFENSGDAAMVDSDVTAASVTFRANATITGSAVLSVGEVAVSNGVSATISAATSGAMEKTGPGTLALTSSRTDNTTLSDGTLVLSGEGVTLDSSRFTFGTEAAKSLSLRLENGAALTPVPGAFNIGAFDSGTAAFYNEGDWTASGDLILGSGTNTSAEYLHAGGTLTIGGHIYIGNNSASDSARSYIEVSGGAIDFSARKHIYVGNQGAAGSRAEMVVKNDAYVAPGMSIVIGNKTGGTMTLTNDAYVVTGKHDAGGHITLSSESDQNGDACALNLFGGVLETRYIAHGSGSGLATINFDGGTLKAQDATTTLITAHNKLDVVVGPKGGTIDSACVSFAIAEPLTGTGGMTFAGGGTVTLNAAPTYAGKSTIQVGTTLIVAAAIAGEKLAFAIPEGLASGLYKVVAISGGGTFANDILSTATLPAGNCHFYLNADKTEIWCIYSEIADADIWIGGTSGSLNDGVNWLSGNVPASGTAGICCGANATLTNPNGSGFAATTIIFPTNSAPTTISGAALTGVAAIVNNSASDMEFQNAVTFAVDIDVVQDAGAIKFTGGATGVKLARRTDIHGTYMLTTSGNHTEITQTTVKSDGVYLLPNGTFYKHNGDFHIEAGGRAQVKNARIATKTGATLLGTNDGEFKVDGEFLVEGNSGKVTHYTGGGTGTFIANKIRVIQSGYIVPLGNGKTVIGADGIVRGDGYVRVSNNGSHWIGSCADWTMYYTTLGEYTAANKYVVYKHSSSTWSIVTFDTTDFYDGTIGRTITAESLIGAGNASSAQKFRVNVTGIGKFVFANTYDDAEDTAKIFTGGLTVSNLATVAAMANAWPGKGDVTLEDTSTFEVAQSGTVTIGGNLSLAENASLAFNFTDKATPPVLALASGKTATLPTTVNVKVTAAEGVTPKGGNHTLTSGIDFTGKTVNLVDKPKWVQGAAVDSSGNLVLTTIAKGFVLIVK